MTYSDTANRRISTSVGYTEGVVRSNPAGRKRGWPRINPIQTIVKGKVVNAIIVAGGSGEIEVYVNGVGQSTLPLTAPLKTVHLDWVHGDDPDTRDIAIETKVVATYVEDEDRWTITAADCVIVPSSAPPGHGNEIDLVAALAGTTEATSFHIAFKSNRIDTANASHNAVRLPATLDQGDRVQIRNDDAADAIQVFPVVGGFINGQAVNTSESIASGAGRIYTQVVTDHWISS